jgi:uncharacterized Tic20 family protein
MIDPEMLPAVAGQTPLRDARILAALGHALALTGLFTYGLGCLLGPLLMWASYKDAMPFVGDHAREAINFNITMLLVCAVLAMPMLIIFGAGLLFAPLILLVVLAWVVLTLFATLKAAAGMVYRYPFALRLIG